MTLATSSVAPDGVLVVAWDDMREGRSRIYYRRSTDGGSTWDGPASGQPLLPQVTYGDSHCFHPQIVTSGTGVVGCAFYVFGKEQSNDVIKVQLAGSWDDGATFGQLVTVTDRSWDPLIDAPAVHGDPNVDFIGEYFGLDAGEEDLALLWTDTRTGVQELFSDVVRTKKDLLSPHPRAGQRDPLRCDPRWGRGHHRRREGGPRTATVARVRGTGTTGGPGNRGRRGRASCGRRVDRSRGDRRSRFGGH